MTGCTGNGGPLPTARAVTRFYVEHRIESPDILPADFARVVGPA
jgi:hypothetical protein